MKRSRKLKSKQPTEIQKYRESTGVRSITEAMNCWRPARVVVSLKFLRSLGVEVME